MGGGETDEQQDGMRSSGRPSIFRRFSFTSSRKIKDRGSKPRDICGTQGPDFEGHARIVHVFKQVERAGCGFLRGGIDPGHSFERLVLIKGPFCFVYVKETSAEPKYAINLQDIEAKSADESELSSSSHHGKSHRVDLICNDEVQYEFTFTSADEANRFCEVVEEKAAEAICEAAQKELGQGHYVSNRKSVAYAAQVAQKVKERQHSQEMAAA